MTRALVAALVVVASLGAASLGVAHADDAAADRAFRVASQRAGAGEVAAIAELEALGAQRPITRWTDDAWAEAARAAERAGDYARARRAHEQVIALAADDGLARRSRATLERLSAMTGAGQWDAVTRQHEQLASRAASGDDPSEELEALEALVRANPGYPRATAIQLAIARGWEEEAQVTRSFEWLREAVRDAKSGELDGARIALVRAQLRHGALDEARAELVRIADRAAARGLEAELASAERRGTIRWAVAGGLVALVALALVVFRRDAGSWRALLRHLRRPPIEALYFVPIATVVAITAQTGNPIVAHAVLQIVIAGAAIAWLSGAMLEAAHRTPMRRRRLGLHLLGAAITVLAVVYLIVDRTRLLDLALETLRHGPAPR